MNRLTPSLIAITRSAQELASVIEDQDKQIQFITKKAERDMARTIREINEQHREEIARLKDLYEDKVTGLQPADDDVEALAKMHADALDIIEFLEQCVDKRLQPDIHPEGIFPCYVVGRDGGAISIRVRTLHAVIYVPTSDWIEPHSIKRLAPAHVQITHDRVGSEEVMISAKFIGKSK